MKHYIFAAALLSAAGTAGAQEGAAAKTADPNAIAFKFYAGEAAKPGNVFFSPYSMYTAFGMAYEGAKGATAEEIAGVFAFPGGADLRAGLASIKKNLDAASKGAEFIQANSFWAQKDYKFLPAYLKTLKTGYGAEARNADFKKKTEGARKEINSWTSKQTKGKIPELFPADSLTAMTRLVLVNAVYFKGQWETTFKKDMTFDTDFTKTGGAKVKVKMMSAAAARDAEYTENEELQALRLPYKGGGLSMLVLLPKRGKAVTDVEKDFGAGKLEDLRKSLVTEKVKVFLPRFKFSAGYKLNGPLAALGMPTAFTDKADFSGMDGTKGLYIQNAFHKAFVEVNEEGTEAAAATGVAMGLKSMPMGQKMFRADRPFLFFIEDTKTGLILFMGRMEDPAKSE